MEDESGQFVALFLEAKRLQENKKNRDADKMYTSVINKIKESTNYRSQREFQVMMGQAYNNRGFLKYLAVDFTNATEDYTAGLRVDPSMHVTFYNRGLIHYRLARFDKAIKDMESSLRLEPCFEDAKQCLGQCLIDRQKTDPNNHS